MPKKYNNNRLLIVTVGLPRSGKSTWAMAQGFPIVNRDSIRLALHGHRFVPEAEDMVAAIALCMVRALFLAGHSHVVVDETCTTRKRRDWWKKSIEPTTVFKHIDTSRKVCMERAIRERDDEIVPVIARMSDQFEPLGEDEFNVDDFNVPPIAEQDADKAAATQEGGS